MNLSARLAFAMRAAASKHSTRVGARFIHASVKVDPDPSIKLVVGAQKGAVAMLLGFAREILGSGGGLRCTRMLSIG